MIICSESTGRGTGRDVEVGVEWGRKAGRHQALLDVLPVCLASDFAQTRKALDAFRIPDCIYSSAELVLGPP